MDALSQFTQSQSQDQLSKAQKAMNDASSEGRGQQIDVPGTYRMRVKVVNSAKGVWPRFEISDQPKTKGDLVLKLMLECVDGTEAVPKGDVAFANITIAKGAGATEEKVRNTASYCKPILCAVTGKKDVQFTDAFLRDHYTVDIGPDKKVVRMHKMTAEVMVVLASSINPTTGKSFFGYKSIRTATAEDKSQSVKSNAPVTEGALAGEIAGSQGELKSTAMDMSFEGDTMPAEGAVEDS